MAKKIKATANRAERARKGKSTGPQKRAKKATANNTHRLKKKTTVSATSAWVGKGPLNHILAENIDLAFPRYACTKAPHGKCIQYEYNSASGQYDLNPQPIDCSHCTHIIEPTG